MSAAATRARRQASAAQRPATRPADSVWVAASAGTGKTKVLTDRVLSLMLHGTPPARILCLTFTKAAAAEMSNRLAQRLARWATLAEDPLAAELAELLGAAAAPELRAEARQLFARVLDAPGGMKIQTLHAFCQSLLGRFPLEAGIAPHFQVLDERSAQEMLQQAREEVLAGLPDETAEGAAAAGDGRRLAEAIAEVSVYAQEQGFGELMAELIRDRARLRRLLDRRGGLAGAERAVFAVLEVDLEETPEGLIAEACADAAFDHMGLRLAVQALAAGGKTDRRRGARIAAWLGAPEARPALFERYLGAFFTKDGQGEVYKTLAHKDALAAAPGIDAVLDGEAQRLAAVRARRNRLRVARASAGLLRLGAAILEAYERHKRARALLDYDDLILHARDLLAGRGAAAWVLFKLDGGLDHILIDEAQDTNPEQWQVVQSLADEFFGGAGAREAPRSVFAVGDAKQSIYSFQRADPGAFATMRDYFARRARESGRGFQTVALTHSFRSAAAVLETVDAVFAREPARDGLGTVDAPLRHAAVRLGQAGAVELWPPAVPQDEAPPVPWAPPLARRGAAPARARLAALIARKIARWTVDEMAPGKLQASEAWLPSRERRLRPSDVLVLVRRRNEFVEELVRELKRLEVPVAGVDRMVLRDQLAVMDLAALGRVLLLPEDDLTLATVLKGPLVGLDEAQLFALAHGRPGSLWESLARHAESDPSFAAAHGHLAALRARADFVPPYELFAEVLTRAWAGGRGREVLLARLGPEANDPIEEFLSLALAYEREHAPSLEGFLHWLEAGAQEVKRDMEHGQDAVRVMTVHGAKGLQAPVVILPDTMQVPPAPGGVLWLERAEHGELMLWPLRKGYDGAVAARARARAQAIREQEYRRLLYVALTRAEDRLIVCGWRTKQAPPEGCWYRLAEAALGGLAEPMALDLEGDAADGWAGPGWRLSCAQTSAPDQPPEAVAPARAAAPPPPAWAGRPAPAEPAPPKPLAPSRPAAEEPAVRSPLGPDRGARFRRGLLVHRLLEVLPELAPAARRAAARRFLASPVHGLAAAEREEIAGAVMAVLEDPALAPLFGPGSRAEVPLIGVVGGRAGPQVVSGQVDRLLVGADSVLAVDYKSHRPAPESLRQVAPLYLRQMAAYRAVLAGIYGPRRIGCALLWTEGPRFMQLSDAVLARHAP